MIKISDRLKSLTKYIYEDDKIMDVGCDHALLDIYLIQNRLINNKIYVCDVNENALNNGIKNIEKNDLEGSIIPILGYGIEKLINYDINTLVISGMGSKNIIDILSSPNLDRIYKLILQSNNNHYELRKYLTKRGFNIFFEEVIKDGKKTYVNIIAGRDYNVIKYTEIEYELGPKLIKNKDNLFYFKELKENYESIYSLSSSEDMRKKIDNINNVINDLEKF